MATHKLTPEQEEVIEASRRGVRRLKVEALAGTGKTSTLVELAKDLKIRKSRQKTLYVAFNKFVVDEVSVKIGRFADAMTVNSLALRMVGREFQIKLTDTPQRMTAHQAANLLGIPNDFVFSANIEHSNGVVAEQEFRITRERMAGMVSRAVLRFCDSLDRQIDVSYFEDYERLGPKSGMAPIPAELKHALVDYAHDYWADISNPNSFRFRFRHEHYMKLWHLSNPIIPYDTVLFDEAQDADPLMRDVVERHQGEVVWCGDRYQAIYGWRGAVNAMEEVVADETLYLTKSFRFSTAIANVANSFLGPLGGRLVQGAAAHESAIRYETLPDVEIFRKNSTLLERFMELAHNGTDVRTDVDLGEYERVVSGVLALVRGERPRHPDLVEFETFQSLNEWLRDQEVEDDEFRILLRQIMRHDLNSLLEALIKARESQTSSSGRLLTTAHKVKGLGFDRVVIADDFPAFSFRDSRISDRDLVVVPSGKEPPKSWKSGNFTHIPYEIAPELYRERFGIEPTESQLWWLCPSREEWQLAYVAVTRAQRELVHPFSKVETELGRIGLTLEGNVQPADIIPPDSFDVTGEWKKPPLGAALSFSEFPDITVAGSSFYQLALEQITRGKTRVNEGWQEPAVIQREPENKFDPNAVSVKIDGQIVGYIPKELAPRVGELLGDSLFEVPALIVGGYEFKGARASFGVRLFLAWE